MQAFLTSALLHLVSALIGGPIVSHLQTLVADAFAATNADGTPMTGDQKRALVLSQLKTVGGDVGTAVSGTASFLLNLGVEAVVAYLSAHPVAPAAPVVAPVLPTA